MLFSPLAISFLLKDILIRVIATNKFRYYTKIRILFLKGGKDAPKDITIFYEKRSRSGFQ